MLVVPSEETITSAIPAAPISLRAKPKRSDLVKGTSFKPLAALFALDALLTRLIPFPAEVQIVLQLLLLRLLYQQDLTLHNL